MLHLGHNLEYLKMERTISILIRPPNDFYAPQILRNPAIRSKTTYLAKFIFL